MNATSEPRVSSTGRTPATAFLLIHHLQPNLVLFPNFTDSLMDRIRAAISGVRGVKLGVNAAFDLTEFANRLEVHVAAPPATRASITKLIKKELSSALGPSSPGA